VHLGTVAAPLNPCLINKNEILRFQHIRLGRLVKIIEILNGILAFSATIRAKRGKTSTTVKTIVFADGISQARALLSAVYGDDRILSVTKVSEINLKEAMPNRTDEKLVPRILPTAYAHKLAQNALLAQMKHNALQVKPTIDDLRAAQDKFEGEQKRIDREYDEALRDREKWADIRKRRLKNSSGS
jgi:hypothetical protein